jgi:hypothetical protein
MKQITSYPKLHYENLAKKNQQTSMYLKPTIRMFKNARSYLESYGMMPTNIVPSYFLECLIYNAPNRCFSGNHQSNFENVLYWMKNNDLSGCVCPDGIRRVFGSGQWNVNQATQFISHLSRL